MCFYATFTATHRGCSTCNIQALERSQHECFSLPPRQFADRYLERLRAIGGAVARVCDKQPTNFRHLGLVARSLVSSASLPASTCQWKVPETWHAPIEQQAVQLRRGTDNKAAAAFLNFLRGDQARRMIISYGYTVPR